MPVSKEEILFSIIVNVSGEWFTTVHSDNYETNWLSTTLEDIDVDSIDGWEETYPQDITISEPWIPSEIQDIENNMPWGAAIEQDIDYVLPWGKTTPLDVTNYTDFTKGTGEVITSDNFAGPWETPWRGSKSIIMINNEIGFTVNGQSVQLLEVNTSTDWDSYCWDFKAVIASRADANICRPGGQPSGEAQIKEGILTVNEYSWDFYIEDISENYEYGSGAYNISGRSRTARIAPPYAAGENRTFSTQRTYPAMIQDELTNSASGIWEDHSDI